MSYEKHNSKIQSRITDRIPYSGLSDSDYFSRSNNPASSDPNIIQYLTDDDLKWGIHFIRPLLPETTKTRVVLTLLACLKRDFQSKELGLLPSMVHYNLDTKLLRLYWATIPNNSCIIRDYIQLIFPPNLQYSWGEKVNELSIILE